MQDNVTHDDLAALHTDVFDTLAAGEDALDMADGIKLAYAKWLPGCRMYDSLPGFLAGVLIEEIEDGCMELGDFPEFVSDLFRGAGLADHPHIDEIVYVVREADDL